MVEQRDGIPALRAGRATIERALELNPPVRVLRVLLVVVADTALWSRFDAPITHRRVAQVTGMSQREITKAFTWLTANDVLGYRPGYSLPNGPRSSSIVTLTVGRDEPRSSGPTVKTGPDHGPTRSPTIGRGGPPNEDPSRIIRRGGARSASAPPDGDPRAAARSWGHTRASCDQPEFLEQLEAEYGHDDQLRTIAHDAWRTTQDVNA